MLVLALDGWVDILLVPVMIGVVLTVICSVVQVVSVRVPLMVLGGNDLEQDEVAGHSSMVREPSFVRDSIHTLANVVPALIAVALTTYMGNVTTVDKGDCTNSASEASDVALIASFKYLIGVSSVGLSVTFFAIFDI